jgi:integrase/recombinase XerD
MDIDEIERPRRMQRLPDILSRGEVENLLKGITNLKHKSMLSLIYACGLRRSELINLEIRSIDSARKLLIIKEAKGKKDRVAPLPESMIEMLRTYYKAYKPKRWLFEGFNESEKYTESSLQQVFKQAVEKAKIKKHVTLHTLRHSYATHLLENGVDLRYIQEILGHKSSKTTEIYTHVTSKSIEKIKSPFENLNL